MFKLSRSSCKRALTSLSISNGKRFIGHAFTHLPHLIHEYSSGIILLFHREPKGHWYTHYGKSAEYKATPIIGPPIMSFRFSKPPQKSKTSFIGVPICIHSLSFYSKSVNALFINNWFQILGYKSDAGNIHHKTVYIMGNFPGGTSRPVNVFISVFSAPCG